MHRVNTSSAMVFKARLMTLRGHTEACQVIVTDNDVTVNNVVVLRSVPNPKAGYTMVHEAAFRSIVEAWEQHYGQQEKRDAACRMLARYVK